MKNIFNKKIITAVLSTIVAVSSIAPACVTAQAAPAKWYTAYTKKISSLKKKYTNEAGFAPSYFNGTYMYINNDNIPEIYLNCDSNHYLLSYCNGKVHTYSWWGLEDEPGEGNLIMEYRKKKNTFTMSITSTSATSSEYDICKLSNKGKKTTLGTSGDGDSYSVYQWNGKDVSKGSFNSSKDKVIGRKLTGYKTVKDTDLKSYSRLKSSLKKIS